MAKNEEKAKKALDAIRELAQGEPKPHFAEAQEHLQWIDAQFKKRLQERRAQRKKMDDEARSKAEALAGDEQNPVLKKLYTASTFEKMAAYLHNFSMIDTFSTRIYTDEQIKDLVSTIPPSEREEAICYQNFFNAMLQYSRVLLWKKYYYIIQAQKLTKLIDLYEGYLADAEVWGNCVKDGSMGIGAGIALEWGEGEDGRLWADRKAGSGWGTLYLYPDGTTKVDIEGDGRLYSKMVEQSEEVAEALSLYKTYVEVLSDLVYNTAPLWALLPINVENLLEYPDSIEEQDQKSKDKYFRFRLRQRRENGETITPEEEKWALYPDYNEVEQAQSELTMAKGLLKETLKQWELNEEKILEMAEASLQKQ